MTNSITSLHLGTPSLSTPAHTPPPRCFAPSYLHTFFPSLLRTSADANVSDRNPRAAGVPEEEEERGERDREGEEEKRIEPEWMSAMARWRSGVERKCLERERMAICSLPRVRGVSEGREGR